MADVEICRVFARNLNRLLAENQMNQLDLSARLGVSTASVSDWVNAKSVPRTPTIQKITEVFGCALSDLMLESGLESTLYALDVTVSARDDGGVTVTDDYSGAKVTYTKDRWEQMKKENDAKTIIASLQSGADQELTEYLEVLRSRPECRMLFSLAKDATKADVEKAVAIIEALRGIGDK